MYFQKIVLLFTVVLMSLSAPQYVIAQDPEIEWDAPCEAEGGSDCTGWQPQFDREILLGDPDCEAIIKFSIRYCTTPGGIVYKEYKITGWRFLAGCEGWDTKSYFHQKFEGLKEYIILGLLAQDNADHNVVDCGSTPIPQISNVYTAASGVWSCCEYEVVSPQIPVCDGYWSGPPPHYGVPPKVKACKWVACGTLCCRRRYSICMKTIVKDGETRQTEDIKLLNKERLGECTGQLPSPAQPCEDGC